MHLKWGFSTVVHGAMPGGGTTLCGKATNGSAVVTEAVDCKACLEQARLNAAAIASILGELPKGGS